MVRTIIALLIVLAVIAGLSIFENSYLMSKLNYFDEKIEIIIDNTDNSIDDTKQLSQLTDWWKKEKNVLHAFVPHNDIRDIDGLMVEANKYIEKDMFDTAAARLKKLDDMITAIKDNYSFSFGNIF